MKINYFHNFNRPIIHSYNNKSSSNITIKSSSYMNTFGNSADEAKKQFHLLDKKIIFILNVQKEKRNKLNNNINNLNERIIENNNSTPQKHNSLKNDYYRKNRSFATLLDSIHNKMIEEKDYNDYKDLQINNEYNNFNKNIKFN